MTIINNTFVGVRVYVGVVAHILINKQNRCSSIDTISVAQRPLIVGEINDCLSFYLVHI